MTRACSSESRPVERFGTEELLALIGDLHETMVDAKGAGLAAPQIGVGLRVVIFGFEHNQRYPDAEPVPYTELVNPVITPLAAERKKTGKAACRCRACAAWCRDSAAFAIPGSTREAARSIAKRQASTPASYSTNAIISTAFLYPMRMRDMRTLGFTSVLFPGVEMPDE